MWDLTSLFKWKDPSLRRTDSILVMPFYYSCNKATLRLKRTAMVLETAIETSFQQDWSPFNAFLPTVYLRAAILQTHVMGS